MELGKVLAASGFFQDSRQAAQAVVKVLAGRELGFGPIASMSGIHIISGKPTLSANLLAAAIRNSGAYDYTVVALDDTACEIAFLRDGKELQPRSTFTIDDAERAGLNTGNNSHSWKKYPRNMLFARAISNGARWHCPEVFSGAPVYTPDELGATVNGETGEVVTVNGALVGDGAPQIVGQHERSDAEM